MKENRVNITVILLIVLLGISLILGHQSRREVNNIRKYENMVGSTVEIGGDTLTIVKYHYFINSFKLSNGDVIPVNKVK